MDMLGVLTWVALDPHPIATAWTQLLLKLLNPRTINQVFILNHL